MTSDYRIKTRDLNTSCNSEMEIMNVTLHKTSR